MLPIYLRLQPVRISFHPTTSIFSPYFDHFTSAILYCVFILNQIFISVHIFFCSRMIKTCEQEIMAYLNNFRSLCNSRCLICILVFLDMRLTLNLVWVMYVQICKYIHIYYLQLLRVMSQLYYLHCFTLTMNLALVLYFYCIFT